MTSSSSLREEDNMSPAALPSEALTTNAVSRHLSDLHTPTWLALLAVNITARTLVFHPVQLAISRKRVTRSQTSALSLIAAAYRGGATSCGAVPNSGESFHLGRGGIRGSYRGVGAALLSNLVGEMSYLFVLEVLKERLVTQRSAAKHNSTSDGEAEEGEDADAHNFSAQSIDTALGAMAGDLVALLVVTPSVLVCYRQMTAGYGMASDNSYKGMRETFKQLWNTYQSPRSAAAPVSSLARIQTGFRGIYQGTSAGLLRIPSSGCWWAIYTKTKEVIYTMAAPTLTRLEAERASADGGDRKANSPVWKQNWLLSPTDNPLLNALAGILASASTTALFNPIAVVQTRQQSLPPEFFERLSRQQVKPRRAVSLFGWRVGGGQGTRGHPFKRVALVAADLVKKEGFRGFFKGTSANVCVSVMDGVVFSLLFEMTKLGSDTQFLKQLSDNKSSSG